MNPVIARFDAAVVRGVWRTLESQTSRAFGGFGG